MTPSQFGLITFLICILYSCPARAGGVSNGQPVNAAVTNAAFIFKNANDSSPFQYLIGAAGSPSGQLQVTGNADRVQLLIRGNATQTANVFACQNNSSSNLFTVNNSGNGAFIGTVSASNFSGTSSGTNTGDVTLGSFGSSPNSNGAALSGQVLTLQPADGTHPGGVSTTTQTIAGNKTFSGTVAASNLSGTNTGDITISTANGLSLSGQAISLGTSSASTVGALLAADWTTFNAKQAAGNYITALTGDVTASGPGSAAATLANTAVTPASYTNASITVDSKGRITAASSGGAATVYQASGYHDTTCSWARTSSSLGDPSADATCGFTQDLNTNLTITSLLSGSDKLPGITFTVPATKIYHVCVSAFMTGATLGQYYSASLYDTVTRSGQCGFQQAVNGDVFPCSTCGDFSFSASATAVVKIQTAGSSGANTFGNAAANAVLPNSIYWTIHAIN